MIKPGFYRHFKGKDYQVIGLANLADGEPLVLYRQLYGSFGLWVRPYDLFAGQTLVDGVSQPRFVFTGETKTTPAPIANATTVTHSETEAQFALFATAQPGQYRLVKKENPAPL